MMIKQTAIVMLLAIAQSAYATHLRAGEITAERVSCTGMTFRITIQVYLDTQEGVPFGGYVLDFGDNSDPDGDGKPGMVIPEMQTTPRPDLGQFMGTAKFTIEHTYAGVGAYIISYAERNRNRNVLNIFNSVNTPFYLETKIVIDPFFGCNNTPQLLVLPIDRACIGAAFFHNPGAYDVDGDSISYEMVIPFSNRNQQVTGYKDPNDASFYTNFPNANEAGNGPPTFSINPADGTIIWDSPGAQGEYNIAFIIVEWRKKNNVWHKLGYVRRDMQIIVEDCMNKRPELILPEDICVEAGTNINKTILGTDPENHPVKIEAFSEIFNLPPNLSPATYSPVPGPNDFQPSNPPATLNFDWNTNCDHVKDQPYLVVFKITDNPPSGPKLVTFKTWRITVVAPPPVPTTETPDLIKRHAQVSWQPYTCTNAEFIQVWRRVGSINFIPDSCQTGMPQGLGYTQIATLPASETSFIDTNNGRGLDVGAQYCYRLVATFPSPKGGVSYVSAEICMGPIRADAPVITHVSVERTHPNAGEVRVSWHPPFDIDSDQFPPEPHGYNYIVQRAPEQIGPFTNVHTGQLAGDTTFLDTHVDTRTRQYHYRVLLFVPELSVAEPVDTSAVASSVWIDLQPQSGKMSLSWKATVPWSNMIQNHPMHDIYRGEGNSETNNQLVNIDQVDVLLRGFAYEDVGQIDDNTTYCYQVVTRGGYGNPAIEEPLINYSQIICAKPNDDTPPCKPDVASVPFDCETFFQETPCQNNVFTHQVKWSVPTESCIDDINFFRVYVSIQKDGSYTLLKDNVRDTFLVETNLTSMARCYRITAVDIAGNESEFSEQVCFDTCPYYELPNVFTPNNDGCNDRFYAWGYVEPAGEEQAGSNGLCADQDPESDEFKRKCARFVKSVDIKFFNRWGAEVFQYRGSTGSENTIYIGWNGRDMIGNELSSGIYYYSAEVTFDTVDPSKRKQTIKGWVHLIR